jgi:hypothetical protein
MTAHELPTKPLSDERSLFMRQAAGQALEILKRFSGDQVVFGPTALQLLDEWIERLERRGPLSPASQVLVIAFLGHTFLQKHGGYWATLTQSGKHDLGVVCPVAGPGNQTRFINIVEQVNQRLAQGILSPLSLFYLTTSVDLQGRI